MMLKAFARDIFVAVPEVVAVPEAMVVMFGVGFGRTHPYQSVWREVFRYYEVKFALLNAEVGLQGIF